MWVRAKVAAVQRDLRALRVTSLGFNPVVVVVVSYETVSAVLDQGRADDTLFVVTAIPKPSFDG